MSMTTVRPDLRPDINLFGALQATGKKGLVRRPDIRDRVALVLPARLAAYTRKVLTPKDYRLLRAGGGYQRSVVKEWSGLIGSGYEAGSAVLEIDVCRRTWDSDSEGFLFIVDGLQRATAAMPLQLDIPVRIHTSESLEDEKLLFSVLNAKRDANGNHKVWADPGLASAALQGLDGDPSHPAFGRIDWGVSHGRGSILSAHLALRTFLTLLGNSTSADVIERANGTFSKAPQPARAALDLWLRVVFGCFQDGVKPRNLEVNALAAVVRRVGVNHVTKADMARVRRIKWAKVIAANSSDRAVLLRRRIAKALGRNLDDLEAAPAPGREKKRA